jgi:hypothetical protein
MPKPSSNTTIGAEVDEFEDFEFEAKLIEVKSPTDSLSYQQQVWLQQLTKIGIATEVCYVQKGDPVARSADEPSHRQRLSATNLQGHTHAVAQPPQGGYHTPKKQKGGNAYSWSLAQMPQYT